MAPQSTTTSGRSARRLRAWIGLGDQLLAAPRLALDDDRGIARSDGLDQIVERPHRGVGAHQPAVAVAARRVRSGSGTGRSDHG